MRIPFKPNTGNKKLQKQSKKSEPPIEGFKRFISLETKGKLIISGCAVIILVFSAILLTVSLNGAPTLSNNNSSQVSSIVLGQTNDSTVVKEGPYGNTSSNSTIAFIVGVHPRESGAHQAIVESIRENDASFNKKYYLYIITAPLYQNNYPAERMNGQKLANEYVVPDIINNHYQLAVDIHSSNGSYAQTRFVFVPTKNNKSLSIAHELATKISWLGYYYPSDPSSTEYVTIPLIKAGIPSLIYEAYKYDSNSTILAHAQEFIKVIDTSQIV